METIIIALTKPRYAIVPIKYTKRKQNVPNVFCLWVNDHRFAQWNYMNGGFWKWTYKRNKTGLGYFNYFTSFNIDRWISWLEFPNRNHQTQKKFDRRKCRLGETKPNGSPLCNTHTQWWYLSFAMCDVILANHYIDWWLSIVCTVDLWFGFFLHFFQKRPYDQIDFFYFDVKIKFNVETIT